MTSRGRRSRLQTLLLETGERAEPFVRWVRDGFVGACLRRATEIDAIARAIALASQAFTAGIPGLIVFSALAPRGRDVADRLIHRFHIGGTTADQIRSLFTSSTDEGVVTVLGLVLLVISLTSMAASLQTVYERCFFFPHIGLRARWRSIMWLLGTAVYLGYFIELRPNVYDGGTNIARGVVSLLGSVVFWLWTPRILLGPRITLRRLVPAAALTSAAVTILVLVSPLYMPASIEDDARRFGMIGVAFALLSWLVVLAFLIVGSAVIASQIDRRRTEATAADGARRSGAGGS